MNARSKAEATDIKEKLMRYFRGNRFRVVAAYLFGSRARGRPLRDSDVDVAVLTDEGDKSKRVTIFRSLVEEIGQALGVEKVDVCMLEDESPRMAFNALKNATLLFLSDAGKQAAFQAKLLQRHFDLEDIEKIRKHYLYQQIMNRRMGEGGIDMLDREAVEERLSYIDQMLAKLKGYRGLSFEEFTGNDTLCHAALYELQTCLEAVTYIAVHFISALSLGIPEDRGEAFQLVCKRQIVSKPLAARLGKAVRTKNKILHGYLRLALEPVYQSIQKELSDIEDFCAAVKQYIDITASGRRKRRK